jgi:NADPH:quinone reductase-like Zn-dependent oxidoreductase
MGAVAGYAPPVDISRELYAKSLAVSGYMVYVAMAATGGAELDEIHDALRSGHWKVPISEIVELEQTAELHRRFEARELMGRNLIRIGGDL